MPWTPPRFSCLGKLKSVLHGTGTALYTSTGRTSHAGVSRSMEVLQLSLNSNRCLVAFVYFQLHSSSTTAGCEPNTA